MSSACQYRTAALTMLIRSENECSMMFYCGKKPNVNLLFFIYYRLTFISSDLDNYSHLQIAPVHSRPRDPQKIGINYTRFCMSNPIRHVLLTRHSCSRGSCGEDLLRFPFVYVCVFMCMCINLSVVLSVHKSRSSGVISEVKRTGTVFFQRFPVCSGPSN